MEKIMIVEGMMCPNCVRHVSNALNDIEGVSAIVDLETKTAKITCEKEIDNEVLKKAVEEEGYTVVEIR